MGGARRITGSGSGVGRIPDADFRRMVDDLKERIRLSDLVGRRVKLKRTGNEFKGLCCFHHERSPSLTVNDAAGFYHCFGCGSHGDAIRFLMDTAGCSFREAYRMLADADLPTWSYEERTKARVQDAVERAEKLAEVHEVWGKSVPIVDSPGERYAIHRGIDVKLPPTVRFTETWAWKNRETGEVGPDQPAIICGCETSDGIMGMQRIFLSPNCRSKANMENPKRSLGQIRGVAHRLGAPAQHVIVCEGPEEGWTLFQEFPGQSVWVGLGTALIPLIDWPPIVERVTLAGNNDLASRRALAAAKVGLIDRGISVRECYPDPAFKDFNDQLLDKRRAA